MLKFFNNLIYFCFLVLFFFTPIFFLPFTSELFEFNKIILTYVLTLTIIFSWILKMLLGKQIIFRRTILDIPLIVFVISQSFSTILSIDQHTSFFGYYSRFNGGLLSIISYSLLYFSFVSNINKTQTKLLIRSLLISAFLVSIWGILEHFGIDKDYWVQDVQRRVFSTLGQPNWLAAWLVAIIPISYSQYLTSWKKIYLLLAFIIFIALLFTKSRSGILAFIIINTFFWLAAFIANKKQHIQNLNYNKSLILINLVLLLISFIIGTPWTPSASKIIQKTSEKDINDLSLNALEQGGTESGTIRKIVWQGALDVWKNYPIFGSGVETFAYSYYKFRPQEHNLVSEWDYLYNKAHNEYLNYLATTGSVGFLSYTILILGILYAFTKNLLNKGGRKNTYFTKNSSLNIKTNQNTYVINNIAYLAGYCGILITNFFGFSVVVVQHLFFLLAGFSILEKNSEDTERKFVKKPLYLVILISTGIFFFLFYKTISLWIADYYFAQGKKLNSENSYAQARLVLNKSISYSKNEAVFFNEISKSAKGIALLSFSQQDVSGAKYFGYIAINEITHAVNLSPNNMNIRRNYATILIELSELDPKLLEKAEVALIEATNLAPTDAKIFYNLSLVQAKLNKKDEAIKTLKKTVSLKSNYVDARYALSLFYLQNNNKTDALKEISYLVENLKVKDEKVLSLYNQIISQ